MSILTNLVLKLKKKRCEHLYIDSYQLLDQRTESKDSKEYLVSEYYNECSFCHKPDSYEYWEEVEHLTVGYRIVSHFTVQL